MDKPIVIFKVVYKKTLSFPYELTNLKKFM